MAVQTVCAQERYDSSYIEDHTNDLTLRALGNYKFSGYDIGQYGINNSLPYKSNDNYSIGVGFSYRLVGLNLVVKAPFINNDDDKRGKTKYIDLQTFLYLRKWTVDLYAQLYKGYYLSDDAPLKTPFAPGTYLLRPDLQTGDLGFNVQYIFNNKRFSYRAAYVQNEYQKKSAGSFIIGGGAHYIDTKADSAVIPAGIKKADFFGGSRYNKSRVVSVALGAGYAQTWIIKKRYFIMASGVGSIGINQTSLLEERGTGTSGSGLHLDGTFRVAAGYNSPEYYAGIQFIEFTTRNIAPVPNAWQQYSTGYFRIVVAKRFKAKKYKLYEMYEKIMPL